MKTACERDDDEFMLVAAVVRARAPARRAPNASWMPGNEGLFFKMDLLEESSKSVCLILLKKKQKYWTAIKSRFNFCVSQHLTAFILMNTLPSYKILIKV